MTRREAERLIDCVNFHTSGVLTSERRRAVLATYEERWGFHAEQLSLAGEARSSAHARSTDPDTSSRAAAANEPSRRNQCGRLLVALVAAGPRGRTADELRQQLEGKGRRIPFNSLTRRCSDLKQLGYARVLGGVERATANGGQAEVLVATDKGEHWVRLAHGHGTAEPASEPPAAA